MSRLLNIVRTLLRLLQLLLFAFLVAILFRASGVLLPEQLPGFWLAALLGLLVIAAPAFSLGWNEHARDVRDAMIRKAEEQYERERR
jgi:hypothetical protein